jgi:hypothetical protein
MFLYLCTGYYDSVVDPDPELFALAALDPRKGMTKVLTDTVSIIVVFDFLHLNFSFIYIKLKTIFFVS